MPNDHSCSGVRQFVGISCVHFLVRRLWRLVFNCHMECPMIIRARVCGRSWAFHVFNVYLTTYGGTFILPHHIPAFSDRPGGTGHSDGQGIPQCLFLSGCRHLIGTFHICSEITSRVLTADCSCVPSMDSIALHTDSSSPGSAVISAPQYSVWENTA